jgi:hypothetical protein
MMSAARNFAGVNIRYVAEMAPSRLEDSCDVKGHAPKRERDRRTDAHGAGG